MLGSGFSCCRSGSLLQSSLKPISPDLLSFRQSVAVIAQFEHAKIHVAHLCLLLTSTRPFFASYRPSTSASWSFTFWGCHNPKKPRKVAKTPEKYESEKVRSPFLERLGLNFHNIHTHYKIGN